MTKEHTTDWKTSLVIATRDEVTEQLVGTTFDRLADAGVNTAVVSAIEDHPKRLRITAAIDDAASPDRAITQLIEEVRAAGVDVDVTDIVAADTMTYTELERTRTLLERYVEENGL